jgi:hypothetical protein
MQLASKTETMVVFKINALTVKIVKLTMTKKKR